MDFKIWQRTKKTQWKKFSNLYIYYSVSVHEHSGYLETMSLVIFQPQPLHDKSYTHDNAARLSAETPEKKKKKKTI